MIPRYSNTFMSQLWSDENKYQTWFRVELAVVEAYEKAGEVPAGTADRLKAKSVDIDWKLFAADVERHEAVTRHDVIAFLTTTEGHFGEDARWVHLGLTSSDVVDTSFALLLSAAGDQIQMRLQKLTEVLKDRAREHRNTLCLGRTHGQAAEITTFGLKLLSFYAESKRMESRLDSALSNIGFGKLSGAVGNYSNIHPDIEKDALRKLGLEVEPVATQVIPRDRHSEFFATLAMLGGLIERISVEIRHLMRSEVAEASEPFGKGQKGSSAMPHKKNPILTENLTGMARLLRSHAAASFENQALWHERDISHSSVERIIAPDATTLADFGLKRLTTVMEGLVVHEGKMRDNLSLAGEMVYSQHMLTALIKKGVMRQKAYAWVQESALTSREGQGSFLSNLKSHEGIQKHLSGDDIQGLFSPEYHLRNLDAIFERVVPARST